MQRLSIRRTRRGDYRVGHDKRHVGVVARDRIEAHQRGKALWRKTYGRVEKIAPSPTSSPTS